MMKNKHLDFFIKILCEIGCASFYALFFKIIVEGRGFLAMGVSGIAVIISRIIGIKLADQSIVSIIYMICYILINIPIIIFGYKKISKKFVLLTLIYVVTFSVVVALIPASFSTTLGFNELDDLTSAVIIGLISGLSCAGALFFGGCAGGLDIISTYLNVKKGKSIGVYNFIFNAIVLTIGLAAFKNVPSIVYTLVYAFFSSLILDKYYNRNKKVMLEIITTKKDEVCSYLMERFHHGCTIIDAKGAYTNDDKKVIHTVISTFQLKSVTRAIKQIDEKSFIIDIEVFKLNGEFYMPPIK